MCLSKWNVCELVLSLYVRSMDNIPVGSCSLAVLCAVCDSGTDAVCLWREAQLETMQESAPVSTTEPFRSFNSPADAKGRS